MKFPIILVLSEGKLNPLEIINNIRKISQDEEKELLPCHSDRKIMGYTFNLITKYYQTNLYLVPFDDDIKQIPVEIQSMLECVLIYFDSGQRSFCEKIPIYAKFLKQNNIEMGILLCDNLYDDASEGITYTEAKQQSRILDVIELNRKNETNDNLNDPVGYEELLQALRSFVWSNINIRAETGHSSKKTFLNKECLGIENPSEASVEAFDELLAEVMDFKNSSVTLSRNDRLVRMENLAVKFEHMIGDEDVISSDEN